MAGIHLGLTVYLKLKPKIALFFQQNFGKILIVQPSNSKHKLKPKIFSWPLMDQILFMLAVLKTQSFEDDLKLIRK